MYFHTGRRVSRVNLYTCAAAVVVVVAVLYVDRLVPQTSSSLRWELHLRLGISSAGSGSIHLQGCSTAARCGGDGDVGQEPRRAVLWRGQGARAEVVEENYRDAE